MGPGDVEGMMRGWLTRLASLFSRQRLDRDLDDEIRAHIGLLAEEYEQRGMNPEEAGYAARKAFGGIEQMKEVHRDRRGFRWIDDARHDAGYAIRGLTRSPGFAVTAMLVVALGIGANTAIFSLLDAVLLRPLPVRHAHELVLASHQIEGRRMMPFAAYEFRALRDNRDVLVDLAAVRPLPISLEYRGESELVLGQMVSASYYDVLGVSALVGRTLTAADDMPTSGAAAVISYGLWQRRFGGSPNALGQAIVVNGRPFTIVGVTTRGFFGIEPGRSVDVTLPLSKQPGVFGARSLIEEASEARWLYLIGRLAPGVTLGRAQAALGVSWDHLRAARGRARGGPASNPLVMLDGARGMYDLREQFSVPLRILMAMVGVVLLVACANLATLLLARSSVRRQEIALRLALGAGRGRLLRQLLTESLVLSSIGGAIGIGLAYVASDALVHIMSRGASQAIALDRSLNLRTLLFTVIASLASGLLFGIAPALRAARAGASVAVRTSAGQTHAGGRWSSIMIGAQVMLSLLLLVEAGLFTRSLGSLRNIDTGFVDGSHVLLATVRTQANGNDQIPRLVALFNELNTRAAALHARSLTFGMDMPLAGGLSYAQNIDVPGRSRESNEPPVWFNFAGPRFFETMGIAVDGRDIRIQDDASSPPVAVISRSLARRFFPGANPLGRRIRTGASEVEVVGVAADVTYTGVRDQVNEMIYLPFLQGRQAEGVGMITLAVNASDDADVSAAALRREVRAVAPDLMIASVNTLEERKDAMLARERVVATLSAGFGALALLLGCVGLYGTLAYAVARRTSEIGVRIAMGADAFQVVRMIVGESVRPVVVGLALGVPLAFAAGRLSQSLLFDVSASDPATYLAAVTMMIASSVCSAMLPARRAARIDPMVALRSE